MDGINGDDFQEIINGIREAPLSVMRNSCDKNQLRIVWVELYWQRLRRSQHQRNSISVAIPAHSQRQDQRRSLVQAPRPLSGRALHSFGRRHAHKAPPHAKLLADRLGTGRVLLFKCRGVRQLPFLRVKRRQSMIDRRDVTAKLLRLLGRVVGSSVIANAATGFGQGHPREGDYLRVLLHHRFEARPGIDEFSVSQRHQTLLESG